MKIFENVKISDIVTMRIGGIASFVIEVTNNDDVKSAYEFAKEHNLPVWVMGSGANTFAKDDGFSGVIIINKITTTFKPKKISDNEYVFEGGSGLNWSDFAYETAKEGYVGIESTVGIPGTLGAAPVQNIGAYGQDISKVFDYAKVYDTQTKKIITLSKNDMQFGYRRSILNMAEHFGRYFVLTVAVKLKKGNVAPPFYNSLQRYLDEHQITDYTPKNIADAVLTIRGGKLPDPKEIASSGSFFKNIYLSDKEADEAEKKGIPVFRDAISKSESIAGKTNKINTAWLIEQCGLKGKLIYGMRVNQNAPLVLMNESANGYRDLELARDEIIDTVDKKFGIQLEQEPMEISPFLNDLDDDENYDDYDAEEEE